jgi:endonuclease-3 related protein
VSPAEARGVFERLRRAYGPQHWWPGDGAFEVIVGAVLTQNTAWRNVESAIAALKAREVLDPEAILALPPEELAQLIRSSGYFNVKAMRLRALCQWYLDEGGLDVLRELETAELRRRLLAVHGIGPETADDILLYAFERPVFVIDAYTRRIFARLGQLDGEAGYEHLRAAFEQALGPDTDLFNEYHALIVVHGKDVCRSSPRCNACCLTTVCAQVGQAAGSRQPSS